MRSMAAWFAAAFRVPFPAGGSVQTNGIELVVRSALEP